MPVVSVRVSYRKHHRVDLGYSDTRSSELVFGVRKSTLGFLVQRYPRQSTNHFFGRWQREWLASLEALQV